MGKPAKEIKDNVLRRANALEIPLERHIEAITAVYEDGGVQGFRFRPKRYKELQEAVAKAIKKMVLFNDDFADSIGAIMGSDARKHGYALTARERNLHSSLHIEMSKVLCDVHLDSHGITTGHVGFPFYGGHYDPRRLIQHGIKDLAPSMLHDTWADFLSPALARLDLDLSVNARNPLTGTRDAPDFAGARFGPAKEGARVGFSLTFKFD